MTLMVDTEFAKSFLLEDIQSNVRYALLRAATVLEKITEADVREMQARLFGAGYSTQHISEIDRLTVGVAYLRACAEVKEEEED